MDLINYALAIFLMYLALQAGQIWIMFALIILSVLTVKSLKVSIAIVVSAVVVYFAFGSGDLVSNFPLILVSLLVVGLILGVGNKPEEQQGMLPPEMGGGYGDLFGGGGGGYA